MFTVRNDVDFFRLVVFLGTDSSFWKVSWRKPCAKALKGRIIHQAASILTSLIQDIYKIFTNLQVSPSNSKCFLLWLS